MWSVRVLQVFVLSPSLYEHILIMDMFSVSLSLSLSGQCTNRTPVLAPGPVAVCHHLSLTGARALQMQATIQGVFYFVVLFISSHLVYVAWRRLRPKFRTAPLTSELDKVEREPVFTTWSAKEVSHWVLEAKAPPRLFGLANVGPLVAKAASKVSAQIFGELDASHRAEIADKMQNQMVKGTVLAGWESVARIKEDLGISIGLADDVWTAVCTLHEETEAATQEWMQLAVKSIKDDLKQSQVKAFPYKLQAAIRFFGYLVFGGCVAIFWGMDWGINCDIRPCGAANRFGLSLVSTTIW